MTILTPNRSVLFVKYPRVRSRPSGPRWHSPAASIHDLVPENSKLLSPQFAPISSSARPFPPRPSVSLSTRHFITRPDHTPRIRFHPSKYSNRELGTSSEFSPALDHSPVVPFSSSETINSETPRECGGFTRSPSDVHTHFLLR